MATFIPMLAIALPCSSAILLGLIHLFFGVNEKLVARVLSVSMLGLVGLLFYNMVTTLGQPTQLYSFAWYHIGHHSFTFLFANNFVNSVYALAFSLIAAVVGNFSITYLHKEQGFFEYYYIFFVFLAAILLTVFSNNLDTLFVGWELVGMGSVLLIGFYKHRRQPILNSFYTLVCYRFGELCLLAALTLAHLQFGDSSFSTLTEATATNAWIVFFILIAVYVKSAQLPFSGWLQRALEGPTPSSAIFYGGISTHLGPMLLVKLYPFLQQLLWVKVTLVVGGFATACYATVIARTRSDVKGQLAYATIAQLGVIFAEVGFGWLQMVVIHTLVHCAARTFQFLKSPSGLQEYLQLRFEERATALSGRRFWYYLARSHFLLDRLIELVRRGAVYALAPVAIYFLVLIIQEPQSAIGLGSMAVSLFFAIASFRQRDIASFLFSISASCMLLLLCSVFFVEASLLPATFYLLASTTVSLVGMATCLQVFRKRYGFQRIDHSQGLYFLAPHVAYVFLFFVLCLSNIPLSLAYLGEDVILYELFKRYFFVGFLAAGIFSLISLSAFAFYNRVFVGAPAPDFAKVELLFKERLQLATLVMLNLGLPIVAFF